MRMIVVMVVGMLGCGGGSKPPPAEPEPASGSLAEVADELRAYIAGAAGVLADAADCSSRSAALAAWAGAHAGEWHAMFDAIADFPDAEVDAEVDAIAAEPPAQFIDIVNEACGDDPDYQSAYDVAFPP